MLAKGGCDRPTTTATEHHQGWNKQKNKWRVVRFEKQSDFYTVVPFLSFFITYSTTDFQPILRKHNNNMLLFLLLYLTKSTLQTIEYNNEYNKIFVYFDSLFGFMWDQISFTEFTSFWSELKTLFRSFHVHAFFFIRNRFIRNLYYDGQNIKKLLVLPQIN